MARYLRLGVGSSRPKSRPLSVYRMDSKQRTHGREKQAELIVQPDSWIVIVVQYESTKNPFESF